MSRLTCPERESGGYQCERLDPHVEDGHWISDDTIRTRIHGFGGGRDFRVDPLPLHRTEAGWPNCSTCDGGGCPDCTDPA